MRAVTDTASIIVSVAPDDDITWIHASMTRPDRVPDYDDLVLLHRAAFNEQWAYQVFAPPEHHIDIHPRALHLFGRADGLPTMPNFGRWGSI